jgi:NAD+ synthase (glutamine-hydrolysing)
MYLANDGNYRELRWFTPWTKSKQTELYALPRMVRAVTGQDMVPFGDAVVSTLDTVIGVEMCEELFTPHSPHIDQSLDGVEIFTNSSGSHHELRKLHRRISLITEATSKCGGVYMYANQQGCDGDRLYYDGSAMVVVNGHVVQYGSQFSLRDVEVVVACVDLEQVRSFRGAQASRGMQASTVTAYPRVRVDVALSNSKTSRFIKPNPKKEMHFYTAEEEISLGPACWLWDYLRSSGAVGFFLPLSGGIDSCSTAVIVYAMCRLVVQAAAEGNERVIQDARRVAGLPPSTEQYPVDPKEFCQRIFTTCYMGTQHSSQETKDRAQGLADAIGSHHVDLTMDSVVASFEQLFSTTTGHTPRFAVHGGTPAENLALQNIQARSRMVTSYMLAQLLPWTRGRTGGLLVLASANVDESLRGYMTKYDCSSADLNPIGAISKHDLKRFIHYAQHAFHLDILASFLTATPSAELIPNQDGRVQSDEEEMGMSYDELAVFGRLRKVERHGPLSMFTYLVHEWSSRYTPLQVADKVKRFFYYYGINRHKMTVLTPSYHAESYSPDDNRFDLRPFLYRQLWAWQFKRIDQVATAYEQDVD